MKPVGVIKSVIYVQLKGECNLITRFNPQADKEIEVGELIFKLGMRCFPLDQTRLPTEYILGLPSYSKICTLCVCPQHTF
jgi:hypothetical protein